MAKTNGNKLKSPIISSVACFKRKLGPVWKGVKGGAKKEMEDYFYYFSREINDIKKKPAFSFQTSFGKMSVLSKMPCSVSLFDMFNLVSKEPEGPSRQRMISLYCQRRKVITQCFQFGFAPLVQFAIKLQPQAIFIKFPSRHKITFTLRVLSHTQIHFTSGFSISLDIICDGKYSLFTDTNINEERVLQSSHQPDFSLWKNCSKLGVFMNKSNI